MTHISELLERLVTTGIVPGEELHALREQLNGDDGSRLIDTLRQQGKITRYQAEALRGAPDCPLLLGNYLLLETIGEGGMGQVFKARHRLMDRLVALKVIRPELVSDPASAQRFRREVQAAARLSHPNIVMAHDAGESEGRHFLVMEFCDGITLGRWVRRNGPLPVAQACEYIRQASLGLQQAYERGLVHRDIKPDNLMICHDGLKILDLGLARLFELAHEQEASIAHTRTGIMIGTADYIAPEQARDAHRADIRADLYSLGCTLYFALCGRPPFPGGTPLEKLLRHQLETPQPLNELTPNLPFEVIQIVNRLMAKDPADRYATPAALAEALRPIAVTPATEAGSSVSAMEPAAWAPACTETTDLLPIPSFPAAAVTDRGDASGQATQDRNSPTEPVVGATTIHPLQVDVATASQSTMRPSFGRKRIRIILPLTTIAAIAVIAVLLYVTRPPSSNNARVLDESGSHTSEEDLPQVASFGPHPGTVNSVAFAGNVPLLAVACGSSWDTESSGVVRLWNLETLQDAGTLTDHQTGATCVAFAPAPYQHVLATGSGNVDQPVRGDVRLWDIRDQSLLAIVHGLDDGVNEVAFSPDGQWLAATSIHRNPSVRVWRVADVLTVGSASDNRRVSNMKPVFLFSDERVRCASFSTQGDLLAIGNGGKIQLWSTGDWSEREPILTSPPCGDIYRLVFSRGDRRLAAVSSVYEIPNPPAPKAIVWNAQHGFTPWCEFGNISNFGSVALTADDRFLLTGDQDGYLRRWNLKTKTEDWRQHSSSGWVRALAISPDERYLAAAADRDHVQVWRLK